MSDLPPELDGFVSLLDTQPGPVREAFQYCLCLMMVENGKMHQIEMLPGESTPLCIFETISGDRFSVPRPEITSEQEADLLDVLRGVLSDEGLL